MRSMKQKKEYHWWQMQQVHSTYDLELDKTPPSSFGSKKNWSFRCRLSIKVNCGKKIQIYHESYVFLARFWAAQNDFAASKMQCTANSSCNEDDLRYMD